MKQMNSHSEGEGIRPNLSRERERERFNDSYLNSSHEHQRTMNDRLGHSILVARSLACRYDTVPV